MILLLLAQAATAPAAPPAEARFEQCATLAGQDARRAVIDATDWALKGGGAWARECLGLAYAGQEKWQAAAEEFGGAGQLADRAGDAHAARFWVQSGNAWLAAGQPAKALAAFDAALARGSLAGLDLGEALFDRARVLVALRDFTGARAAIERAKPLAGRDPLLWLSSAALARRMGDLPLAKQDVGEAFRLSPDDFSVRLEIGDIAAAAGDIASARLAWEDVAKNGGAREAASEAKARLAQLPER